MKITILTHVQTADLRTVVGMTRIIAFLGSLAHKTYNNFTFHNISVSLFATLPKGNDLHLVTGSTVVKIAAMVE